MLRDHNGIIGIWQNFSLQNKYERFHYFIVENVICNDYYHPIRNHTLVICTGDIMLPTNIIHNNIMSTN